jgi:hypothetical protein
MNVDTVVEEIAKDAAAEADKVAADEAAKTAEEEPAKDAAEEAARDLVAVLTALMPLERQALH